MLPVCIGNAQELFPPSRTVEQTRVPVFAGFSPGDKPQQIAHPEPLANFRLVMEYRLEKPGDRLALELGPSATLELPPVADGSWRVLQLRYELTGRRKGVFEASVDGQLIKQASLPPPGNVQPVATFPDGVRECRSGSRCKPRAARASVPHGCSRFLKWTTPNISLRGTGRPSPRESKSMNRSASPATAR